MLDDAAELLLGAGEEAGNVLKGDQRNIESVTKSDEARAFHGSVDIKNSRKKGRLIADDPDRAAIETRKTHNKIFRVMFVDFEKIAIVNDGVNGVLHVIRLLRIAGNKCVERFVAASGGVGCGAARGIFQIVRRKKTHQLADHGKAIGIIPRYEVCHAAGGVVSHRAAKLLLGDFLVRDRLDDVRAGNKHVGRFAGHKNEISDGW